MSWPFSEVQTGCLDLLLVSMYWLDMSVCNCPSTSEWKPPIRPIIRRKIYFRKKLSNYFQFLKSEAPPGTPLLCMFHLSLLTSRCTVRSSYGRPLHSLVAMSCVFYCSVCAAPLHTHLTLFVSCSLLCILNCDTGG
jgi:hypothetical protein